MTETDDAASPEENGAQTPYPNDTAGSPAPNPARPSAMAEALRTVTADGQKALDLYRTQQTAMARHRDAMLQAQHLAQSTAADLARLPALAAGRQLREVTASLGRIGTSSIATVIDSMNRRNAALLDTGRIARSVLADSPISAMMKSIGETQASLKRMAIPPLGESFIANSIAAMNAASPLPQIAQYSRLMDLARQDLTRNLTAMNGAWHRGLLFTPPALPQLFPKTWPSTEIARQLSVATAFDYRQFDAAARLSMELHRLLRSWQDMAHSTERMLAGLARAGYLAALRARDAAVRGDMDLVADFIEAWLRLAPTRWRIKAVAAALIEEGWDEQPAAVLDEIRVRAQRQRRAQRAVWETKLRGKPIGLLGEPVILGDGSAGTMADLITDHTSTEEIALIGQFCWPVQVVLGQLRPDERAVALAFAHGIDEWHLAAEIAGADDPQAFGQRVYRKIRRLGKRYTERHNGFGR